MLFRSLPGINESKIREVECRILAGAILIQVLHGTIGNDGTAADNNCSVLRYLDLCRHIINQADTEREEDIAGVVSIIVCCLRSDLGDHLCAADTVNRNERRGVGRNLIALDSVLRKRLRAKGCKGK